MMDMRRILLATTSVAALSGLLAEPARAQGSETIEKVTVTGTRIKQPNTQNNVSTQSVNAQKIELSGEANVVDVLRDLPIVGVPLVSSANSNFLTTANGVNTLDLRNLGSNRTLVLINGRRVVAGLPLSQVVDFNAIPTELIERVDVLSGGSSAIYGSDAVAGVVNVILKKNFEGLTANFQAGGMETYPDADSYRATATMGGNFADDKGNAVISLGYNHQGVAYARSRDPIDCLSGLFVGGSAFEQVCPVFSGFAEGGVFRLSDNVGSASVHRVIDHIDGTTIRPRVGADGFNRQSQRLHLVPSDRYQFTGAVNYEVAPSHRVFAEVAWTNTVSNAEFEPIPLASENIFGNFTEQEAAVFGVPAGILPNNPYIPRDLLNELGTRFGIVNPHLLARATLVNQLMAIPGAVIGFQRRMTELGNRGNNFESSNGRFVAGVEGKLGLWDYEASVSYGRTAQNQISEGGGVNESNMRESLNVVDLNTDLDNNPLTNPQDVICANPIAVGDGCVPVNLFIPVRSPGSWTAAQVAWLSAPVYRTLQQEQLVASFSATGSLMENWAGTIDAALGAEYRREEGHDLPDALTRSGQNTGNITPVTGGAFDVWEVFGEVDVPLLADLPLAKEVNVHGAIRASEYSTFGYTMAWSADGEWIPTDGIRLRAQVARAVRAPNIAELFTGASENFAVVTDPCNNLRTPAPLAGGPNDPLSPNFNPVVTANCLAIPAIAARAATPGGFVLTQPELQGTGGFGQGNPNLRPEKSDSQQFGIVITPEFWGELLGNLTVSVDYFRVDISDAIAAVSRDNTLDICFQTPGAIGPGGVNAGISPFCDQTPGGPVGWTRDLNGALTEVNVASGNVNQLEADGFELQAGYNVDVAKLFGGSDTDNYGRLSLSGVWQHNNTLDQTVLAGTPLATLVSFVGSVGVFDDEVNIGAVYSLDDLTLSWSSQWMSSANGVDEAGDLAPESIPAQWFHDISATYDIMENISVYGGVRNVTNNYVFIGPSAFAATPTGWSTEPDTYDGLGRRYFFGVRMKM